MNNKKTYWEPSDQDNLGPISDSYYLIKKELENLKERINCNDNFIYDFLGAIQKEWNPMSCSMKYKSFKNKKL